METEIKCRDNSIWKHVIEMLAAVPGHALVQRRQGWGDGVWDPHGAICRAEPVSAVRGRVCVGGHGGKWPWVLVAMVWLPAEEWACFQGRQQCGMKGRW